MEMALISQNPDPSEKLLEITTIVDPHTLQRKATGVLQQSSRSQASKNIINAMNSSRIGPVACSKRYGIVMAGAEKSLLYTFDVKRCTVKAERAQMTSISTGAAAGLGQMHIIEDAGIEVLFAAAEEQLFVWMLPVSDASADGDMGQSSVGGSQASLVATLIRHTQKITFIRTTENNEFVVTGSDDGFINIYSIFEILEKGSMTLPIHSFKASELEITGVNLVNTHSHFIRLFVAGKDQCLRFWDIDLSNTGEQAQINEPISYVCNEEFSYNFDVAVSHLVVDNAGLIAFLTLLNQPNVIKAFCIRSKSTETFKSLTDTPIKKLLCTADSRKLLSLDDDAVQIWDTRQKVSLRTIQLKNPVDMVLYSPIPSSWFDLSTLEKQATMPKFLPKQEPDRVSCQILSCI